MPLTRRMKDQSSELLIAVVGGPLTATSPIEQDFARLYKEVHPQAVAFARRFLPYEAACDVVHDVSLELWKHWTQLPLDAKRPSYFLRRVLWRAQDHRKRDRKLVSLPRETDAPLEQDAGAGEYRYPTTLAAPLRVSEVEPGPDAVAIVESIVQSMPEQRQRVLLLARDGFTWEEIAETMGIAVKTVGRHMNLARRMLRDGAVEAGLRLPRLQFKQLPAPKAAPRREEPNHG